MDDATDEFYTRNAKDVAARYEATASSIARYFGVAFAAGSRVLDVGAGSGRDLASLLRDGFEAFGVEPVGALRVEALDHHPELSGRLASGALPVIGVPFGGTRWRSDGRVGVPIRPIAEPCSFAAAA